MRTFEFRSGTSAKFWSVDVSGVTVTTRWGRIGTNGQEKVTRFAKAALAKAAAEEQMAKKLAAGYHETGTKTKPLKLKPAPKPVSKPKPAVRQRKPAAAKPMVAKTPRSTKQIDELFGLGYPHLRRLAPPLGKGVAAAVKKQLAAGDPEFAVDVPEDVARAFLSAMAFDRRTQTAEREAAITRPVEVDRALLDTFLERVSTNISETYSFRILDAIWLFEAFLGTEVVAETLVAHLLTIMSPSKWDQLTNSNYHAFDLVDALGFMRLRMPSVRWTAITHPLREIKKSKLLLSERILLLLDPARPVKGDSMRGKTTDIALERGDAATLRTVYNNSAFWYSARFAYLVGDEHFEKIDYKELLRLPAWLQRQVVAEYGMLHGPHVTKIMETLATGRSAAKEAAAWLEERGTAAPTAKGKAKAISYDQANKLIDKAMTGLEKRLLAAGDDKARQAEILKEVYQTYCEARAAAGDITPEAYFTHRLAEISWNAPKSDWARWLNVALDVANGKPAQSSQTDTQANKQIAKTMADLEKQLLAAKGNYSKETTVMKRAFKAYRDARTAAGDSAPGASFLHRLAEVKWTAFHGNVGRWIDIATELVG